MNSQKTVIEKLNLAKYPSKVILNIPDDVEDFNELEYDVEVKKEQYDLIFAFIFTMEEYEQHLKQVVDKNLLKENGYLYFAYPKKGNKKYDQYIERDTIYTEKYYNEERYIHGSQLKFARMASFNDVFTVIGIKAQPEKKKKTTSTKASQCVDDYIEHIEDLKKHFADKEETLKIYNELTYGYQKDWARYVYSAKRQATQEKRLADMESVLAAGYKTMDLYRQR
ncbi:MAG: YdeI/OmpD-associated family protein [Bacillota bacterium]